MRIGNDPDPLHLLQPDDDLSTLPVELEAPDEAEGEERAVLCAACENAITRSTLAIEIASKHEHVFMNPAGILYRIRCYSSANGIQRHGDYTDEWSWFPSRDWCYASCGACQAHLGWHYRGSSEFYGLIAERIIEME